MPRRSKWRVPPKFPTAACWWGGAAGSALAAVVAWQAWRLLAAGSSRLLCDNPRIWLEPDFLSADEVAQLLAASADAGSACWERVSAKPEEPNTEMSVDSTPQTELESWHRMRYRSGSITLMICPTRSPSSSRLRSSCQLPARSGQTCR